MQWIKSGNNYFIEGHKEQIIDLPRGIYKLNSSPVGLYLNKQFDKFPFDYKVYDMETEFIKRVIRQYNSSKGNLGVLLNGLKGTGKTVAAKLIANEMNIPCIIVPAAYDNLPSFINSLREDVVLFFDEYEKMYETDESSILTVMDGVLDNGYRRLYLLTTNNKYINENMLQRPGRIRYIKNFTDLSTSAINEIIEDKLVNKDFRSDLVKYVSQLTLITVDLLKSIIDEINIHGDSPDQFRKVFNATSRDNTYDVYEVKGKLKKPTLLYYNREISPVKFTEEEIGQEFNIGGNYIGDIEEILSNNTFKVKLEGNNGAPKDIRTFKVEYVENYHKNYKNYNWDL
ncbi:MAG: AAA family ATPase [Richelia sp. RM2_1_2]|nr:AAA family ATPase [Richelia sp. RM2_1_2]